MFSVIDLKTVDFNLDSMLNHVVEVEIIPSKPVFSKPAKAQKLDCTIFWII